MRNSIQGPLLRTGNNSSFKALGETGYPVFKMAFQLREAIYRLDAGRDLARHLAIPQNDQGGDRTDWYSSFPGDVIPWSGATEAERASARQQFSEFLMAVQALSEQMLNAEKTGAGGDRIVFAQLLKSVVHFPDDEFLYLVNGILVVTFWGFVHPAGEQRNPMHWLQSSSVPVHTSVAHPNEPLIQSTPIETHTTEAVAQTRRWNWRWLLWLLLGLLLLALLLGLLRGCIPSLSAPAIPGLSSDKNLNLPVSDTVNGKSVEGKIAVSQNENGSLISGGTNSASSVSVASPADANLAPKVKSAITAPNSHTAEPSAVETPNAANDIHEPSNSNNVPNAESAGDVIPAVNPQTLNSEQQPSAVIPRDMPPLTPAQGEPLTLPTTLNDGPAQFLNGHWRVNGGIQDKLTGRPLQLQYNFNQGNGTVSVRQSNGVICTGAAKGNVQQGALNITNPEQMKCSDGTNFIGPTIECKSPASGHADCVGNNDGDKTFPIRMLQPNT